jgi:hypothetical protein
MMSPRHLLEAADAGHKRAFRTQTFRTQLVI